LSSCVVAKETSAFFNSLDFFKEGKLMGKISGMNLLVALES
jgi:hypothetical protein